MSSLGILCLFFIQNARIQTNLKLMISLIHDIIFEMSKIAGKVKNKMSKGTDMLKSVNQGQNQALNRRKRSGEDLDLQRSSPPVATKQLKQKTKHSGAKRKIDFSKDDTEKQSDDEVAEEVLQKGRTLRRTQNANDVSNLNHNRNSYRVQWTQEFLDKVRKSNEKCKNKKSKGSKNQFKKDKPTTGDNVNDKACNLQFQNQASKGDGVNTSVDNSQLQLDMDEVDLLD